MNRHAGEAVVCVHGLWLSGFATRYWRNRLAQAGYEARAFSYPSVRGSLEHNCAALARFVQTLPAGRVHFAGHSLGAVTILTMLDAQGWRLGGKELGRIVLAGPPYLDSMAGRALLHAPAGNRSLAARFGRALAGRALADWLAGPRPTVPAGIDLGVIAGDATVGLGRLIAADLRRPHDGTVSVAETRVAGAREHLVLPVGHTAMLMSPLVMRRMLRFLDVGSFA